MPGTVTDVRPSRLDSGALALDRRSLAGGRCGDL
jgi:hypothetical protein